MLVRQTPQGWDIVYQSAHALLAAELVFHWRADQRPLRWAEALHATAQHDNGWQEWEGGQQLTDQGEPRDFTQTPTGDIVLQAERVVTRAWHQSRWLGLLVSQHVERLYAPQRGMHQALDTLLSDQRALRASWRQSLGVAEGDLAAAQALLWWGDRLSLLLCQGALPRDGEPIELAEGPDHRLYRAARAGDDGVTIVPWPYEVDRFSTSVDVHHLDARTFETDEALALALRRAPVSARTWTIGTTP